MTDRELLELAAKAAGIEITRWNEMLAAYETNLGLWNALYNDGDALRLAYKIKLSVSMRPDGVMVVGDNYAAAFEKCDAGGRGVATRRAIVRVAAEIGKGMK